MIKIIALVGSGLIAASSAAFAGGDAAAGKAKSAICAGCHGANGVSATPMYPNLAGQKEQYLATAIGEYKSGARSNATMKGMAAGLTDADIANLAAYFASLSCK
ncbi:MAG: cytochrome c [Gammaproteobacteria bacterium]|jgi:cytochrome c553|nr:cytochrome c [Gammaproteobacteria bacterium]